MHRALVTAMLVLGGAGQAFAGSTNSIVFIPAAIPTLDEIGLTILTVVVAVYGGLKARRRNKK